MTINERIRKIRKDLKLNQTDFALKLGMTQTGVSYLEKRGTKVNSSTIKSICAICGISETWLVTGEGPIYDESDFFNLSQMLREAHATELEIEILKAYFDLDYRVRCKILNHFRCHLGNTDSIYEKCPRDARELENSCLSECTKDLDAI